MNREDIDLELLDEFVSSCREGIAALEETLLGIEQRPHAGRRAAVEAVRRRVHTLKGECGVLSMRVGQELCHEAEGLVDRDPLLERSESVEALLALVDWFRQNLSGLEQGDLQPPDATVLRRVLQLCEGVQPDPGRVAIPDAARADETFGDYLEEIGGLLESIEAALLLFEKESSTPERLGEVFGAFHTIKGLSGFYELDEVVTLAHTAETLLAAAREVERALSPAEVDLLFRLHQMIGRIIDADASRAPHVEEVQQLLTEARAPGVPAPPGVLPGADAGRRSVPGPASAPDSDRRAAPPRELHDTVKVPTERLDRMVDMIGELVIAEQMVSEALGHEPRDERTRRGLSSFTKITRDLQQMAMRLRLVSLKPTFQRLSRVVRDVARKVGKDVRLVTHGHDLEMDRSVVEGIADPLVHLLRNAIDHGIEPPDERLAAGKEAGAVITLSAYKRGSSMVIEVADDGRGLDRDRILARALRTGLRAGERPEEMSDADVYCLILRSGFSTANTVTDLSGRGVGMDVVRRGVESLRGHLEIDSVAGQSTTFRVVLPLTLAILEGLVVRCGAQKYVLPLASVEMCCAPASGEFVELADAGRLYPLRGEALPVHSLEALLDDPVPPREGGILAVVQTGRGRACLHVDQVLGQQQAVLKNIGELVPEIRGVSGGTILGDGEVTLILDVDQLLAGRALAASTRRQEVRS